MVRRQPVRRQVAPGPAPWHHAVSSGEFPPQRGPARGVNSRLQVHRVEPDFRAEHSKNSGSSAPIATYLPSEVRYVSYQGRPPSSMLTPRSSFHWPATMRPKKVVISDAAPSTIAASTTCPVYRRSRVGLILKIVWRDGEHRSPACGPSRPGQRDSLRRDVGGLHHLLRQRNLRFEALSVFLGLAGHDGGAVGFELRTDAGVD